MKDINFMSGKGWLIIDKYKAKKQKGLIVYSSHVVNLLWICSNYYQIVDS